MSGAIAQAGIDMSSRRHGTHALRSSLASHLLEDGKTYPEIQQVLGHASPDTARHYYDKQILMASCPGGYTVLLKYPPEQLSIINASIH